MSEDAGVISYTVEADTADLLNAESTAEKFVKTVTTGMKSADAAVDRFKSTMSNLGRTVNDVGEVITSFGKIDQEATTQLKNLTAQAKLARYQSQGIGTSMTKSAVAVKKFALQKGGLQNISYQLQDMVVQAQMGTNIFTILAQQGPQLAMSWGAAGAAIGVLVAIAGALGGVLYKAFSTGANAAKELEKNLKQVQAVLTLSSDGTAKFSSEIQRLAEFSQEAAKDLLQLTIAKQMDIATEQAKKLNEQFDDIQNVFQSLRGTNDLVEQLYLPEKTAKNYDKVKQAVFGTGESFRDAKKSVTTFESALKAVQKNPTEKTVNNLLTSLEGFKVDGEYATKTARDLAENVTVMATKFLKGEDTAKALREQLDKFDQEGGLTWTDQAKANEKSVNSILNNLYLTQDQLGQTATEQEILSAQNQLGVVAWKKYGAAITYAIEQAKKSTINQEIKEGQKSISGLNVKLNKGTVAYKKWQTAQAATKAGATAGQVKKLVAQVDELNHVTVAQKIKDQSKAIDGLNIKLSQGTMAYKKWQAEQEAVNEGASSQQTKKLEEQASAIEKITEAENGRSLSKTASIDYSYTVNNQDLQAANEAGLVSHQEFLTAKKQLDDQYNYQMSEAIIESYGTAGRAGVAALNSLSSAGATAISSLLTGTENLKDAMASLAQTILSAVLQSLIQTAVQYELMPALAQALGTAQVATAQEVSTAEKAIQATNAASHTAAVTAQVGETAALAGENAYAATAAIPLVGPGLAPAAAAAATGAATGLGSTAIGLAPTAGMRRYGGGVSGDNTYRINESGVPEVYSSGGKDYLMATRNATVSPATQSSSGSSRTSNSNSNTINYSPVINITQSGSGSQSQAESQSMGNQLNKQLKSTMADFITQQQRPGGLLYGR